jgi:hypothetical protein
MTQHEDASLGVYDQRGVLSFRVINFMAKYKPVPKIKTKALFTVAQQEVACSKCKAPAGFYCIYPSGGRTTTPHRERNKAYSQSVTEEEFKARHSIPFCGMFNP